MKIGPLDVVFHRTVRVADGRTPSNLPPSLGRAVVTPVSKYKANCPESWEESGCFIPLHDTEALWISFAGGPVAVLVGAGGINAISGQKLGTKLEAGGYIVTPPQPWLDGWKNEDGTVFQFVATPFKAGEGLSVGEQILGAESKSGGIGIAVFEPKTPLKAAHGFPIEGIGNSPYGDDFSWKSSVSLDCAVKSAVNLTRSASPQASASRAPVARASEMGLGKGGRIIQKIYADPYGLEVWKEEPSAAMAFYLVSAEDYAAITGIDIPKPVGHETYQGNWFGLKDQEAQDTPGTAVFAGLKTVFAGDTSNVHVEEEEVPAADVSA